MTSAEYEKLALREISETGHVSPSLAIKILIHMKSLEPKVTTGVQIDFVKRQIDQRLLDPYYGVPKGFHPYLKREVSA